MEKITYFTKSTLKKYNDKAIRKKLNRSIQTKFIANLPEFREDGEKIRYPVMWHMLAQDNPPEVRCQIAAGTVHTINGEVHSNVQEVWLDMDISDFHKLPTDTIDETAVEENSNVEILKPPIYDA